MIAIDGVICAIMKCASLKINNNLLPITINGLIRLSILSRPFGLDRNRKRHWLFLSLRIVFRVVGFQNNNALSSIRFVFSWSHWTNFFCFRWPKLSFEVDCLRSRLVDWRRSNRLFHWHQNWSKEGSLQYKGKNQSFDFIHFNDQFQVKLGVDKVVDSQDIEDVGEKKAYCRCWKSNKVSFLQWFISEHFWQIFSNLIASFFSSHFAMAATMRTTRKPVTTLALWSSRTQLKFFQLNYCQCTQNHLIVSQ